MKTCSRCKVDQPTSEFGRDKARKDGLSPRCKSCRRKYSKEYVHRPETQAMKKEWLDLARQRTRKYVRDILERSQCADCSESNWILLEFDHLGDKMDNVSQLVGWGCSNERIQQEIDKCEVVCANCHRLRTYSRHGSWRIVESV